MTVVSVLALVACAVAVVLVATAPPALGRVVDWVALALVLVSFAGVFTLAARAVEWVAPW